MSSPIDHADSSVWTIWEGVFDRLRWVQVKGWVRCNRRSPARGNYTRSWWKCQGVWMMERQKNNTHHELLFAIGIEFVFHSPNLDLASAVTPICIRFGGGNGSRIGSTSSSVQKLPQRQGRLDEPRLAVVSTRPYTWQQTRCTAPRGCSFKRR